MDDKADELQREVEQLPKSGRRRLYSEELKRRVLAYVERRIAGGSTESKASVELGIHQATISDWRGRKKRRTKKSKPKSSRVRSVEVVASPKRGGLVLVFGTGTRVEGVTVEDVVALAKELR